MRYVQALIGVILLAATTFAGSYEIVYQRQIPGAEEYEYLEPVIDGDSAFFGAFGSAWSGVGVRFNKPSLDSVVVIDVGEVVGPTANYFDSSTDQLYLYVLEGREQRYIERFTLSPELEILERSGSSFELYSYCGDHRTLSGTDLRCLSFDDVQTPRILSLIHI